MLLQVRGLTKRFPGVVALEDVDLDGSAGEVHALVGANGAGKSTLMNVLSGVFPPSAGDIRLDGETVSFASPRQAAGRGISTVYQEFSSIPELTVALNVFLGREPAGRMGLLDRRALVRDCREVLERHHLDLDPNAAVETLSVAQQQLVEIARALAVDARVLILDEPTAVLSLREQENLFSIIRGLKADGLLVLYVSHRMEEIFSICDRATVLRDGRLVGTVDIAQTSQADIVRMMIGQDLAASRFEAPDPGEPILSVALDEGPHSRVTVHRGEIVGLAGLVGAGRTEFARRLIGLGADGRVEMDVDGKRVTVRSPAEALRHGIVYLTEDRKRDGLFSNLSILWNASAGALGRFATRGLLRFSEERQDGGSILERLRLVASSIDVPVSELSGGNQQKVVFGRALLCRPRVLICDEPTRGVDVGAKEEIYRLLVELAGEGVAIVFISSEMKELLRVTHRLLVMRDGAIVRAFETSATSEEEVLLAATGTAERAA